MAGIHLFLSKRIEKKKSISNFDPWDFKRNYHNLNEFGQILRKRLRVSFSSYINLKSEIGIHAYTAIQVHTIRTRYKSRENS